MSTPEQEPEPVPDDRIQCRATMRSGARHRARALANGLCRLHGGTNDVGAAQTADEESQPDRSPPAS